MYRTWFGILLLVCLLIFGFAVSIVLQKLQAPVSAQLEDAAQQALLGDLQAAQTIARRAHQKWLDRWRITAVFSDHAPMDEIDGLFGQLYAYENMQDFAACCRRISLLVEAVWEAHALTWWNLL